MNQPTAVSTSPPATLQYAVPDPDGSGPAIKLLARPIGWSFHIATVVLAAVTLYADSGPVPYIRPSLIAAIGWTVILAVYPFRFVAGLVAAIRFDGLKSFRWRGYAVVPSVAALIVVFIAADVPRRTAFAIARPAMDRLAAQQLLLPDGSTRQAHIGSYGQCTVFREGATVFVLVHGTEFWDINGFARCPSGPPAGPGMYIHFYGPWYRYFRSM